MSDSMCLRSLAHSASSLVLLEMFMECEDSSSTDTLQPIRANTRTDKTSHSGENQAAEVAFKVTIGWLLATFGLVRMSRKR